MGWIFELSWLWKMLSIALSVSLICVVCVELVCKAVKRTLGKKLAALIGAAAFVAAVVAVILLARTPALI